MHSKTLSKLYTDAASLLCFHRINPFSKCPRFSWKFNSSSWFSFIKKKLKWLKQFSTMKLRKEKNFNLTTTNVAAQSSPNSNSWGSKPMQRKRINGTNFILSLAETSLPCPGSSVILHWAWQVWFLHYIYIENKF